MVCVSTTVETSLGKFARLPAEIRVKIWELLLLAENNETPIELHPNEPPIVLNGERLNFKDIQHSLTERHNTLQHQPVSQHPISIPDTETDNFSDDEEQVRRHPESDVEENALGLARLGHGYRLSIAILRTSKLINNETWPILYARNLFVQLRMSDKSGSEWWLGPGIVEASGIRYLSMKPARADAAKWRAMDISLCGKGSDPDWVEPRVFMFPATQLPSLVARLSSLLVNPGADDMTYATFGNHYGISMHLFHSFELDPSELGSKLLRPFQGLTAFRRSSITAEPACNVPDAYRALADSLSEPGINVSLWIGKMTMSHKELLSVAKQTGMLTRTQQISTALHCDLGFGTRFHVQQLGVHISEPCMRVIESIHRSALLIQRYCEFRLMCLDKKVELYRRLIVLCQ